MVQAEQQIVRAEHDLEELHDDARGVGEPPALAAELEELARLLVAHKGRDGAGRGLLVEGRLLGRRGLEAEEDEECEREGGDDRDVDEDDGGHVGHLRRTYAQYTGVGGGAEDRTPGDVSVGCVAPPATIWKIISIDRCYYNMF